ncbi:MAG: DUF5615 family PIN-like protein [Longimicrobiales bacterium]
MIRFVLDEDIPPRAAAAARGLGLDAVGVAELGRLGWSDEEQLRAAAGDCRVLVTYNRNDYMLLTRRCFEERAPLTGVLIVPGSLPRRLPERLAHALKDWEVEFGAGTTTYLCTFSCGLPAPDSRMLAASGGSGRRRKRPART